MLSPSKEVELYESPGVKERVSVCQVCEMFVIQAGQVSTHIDNSVSNHLKCLMLMLMLMLMLNV